MEEEPGCGSARHPNGAADGYLRCLHDAGSWVTRAKSASAYAASIRSRVSALARAHHLLASSNQEGADLGEIVDGEEGAPTRERVTIAGEPPRLRLPPHLVQPLTLVIHELMTNAMRHGSLSRSSGTLAVTWAVESATLTLT